MINNCPAYIMFGIAFGLLIGWCWGFCYAMVLAEKSVTKKLNELHTQQSQKDKKVKQ